MDVKSKYCGFALSIDDRASNTPKSDTNDHPAISMTSDGTVSIIVIKSSNETTRQEHSYSNTAIQW